MADTEIVIPQALAPFQRVWTDVVERPLDIFPFPNQTINSTNCSQIIRFDFPGNQFLDVVHRPMYLEFNLKIAAINAGPPPTPAAFVAEYCGFLINTIRVFVNNELTEEILNVGQLNTLMQAMMETTDTQANLAGEMRGAPQSQFNVDYAIEPTGAALGADALAADNWGFIGPTYAGATVQQTFTNMVNNGMVFRIPIAPKGSFFSPPQGLIPLFRLPNVRIEFTFNPKQYVLIARGPITTTGDPADSALPDYSISNMRISCMYAQSIAMAKVYSEPEWLQSFMGYYFYTVPLQSTNNLLPVVTAFKSTRYLIGVLANPAQFTGDQPSTILTSAQTVFIGGNPRISPGQTTVLSDKNRFTYFYGLGGTGQGANVKLSNLDPTGPINPLFFRGRDAFYIPNALNFQQNNEWIYQQDLTTRGQFFEEILKVFPEVQHSVFFNTWNFPGLRGVVVINLQSPALKEQFICGNRAAEGQATSFIKLNLTRNLLDNTVTTGTGIGSYLNSVQLMLWLCFDKTLRVNMDTGLATVDS